MPGNDDVGSHLKVLLKYKIVGFSMAEEAVWINLSSFWTFRIHNTSSATLISLQVKDCVQNINKFRDEDKGIIKLIELLVNNRKLERRKVILGEDIQLEYQNGDVAKMNHDAFVSILEKDTGSKEVMDLLINIVG
ncbi:hypothetical protein [Pantoea cypripedii]|uniref:Uncharacterized protein n=1 Tax=Pantoea cypripedii TaxID=55209 RepID=A0A1X1EKX7_PANCY|nr:hypothetical protein [Pantoea cypripedii]MBP2199104.1 hypothetical protein [Pantoea cypripedii]ORM89503.1 hypothetical protein HA50_23050 [Pantoea cypripedii]